MLNGNIVGALVMTDAGLVIVNVAGLNTPTPPRVVQAEPVPAPIPHYKRPLAHHLGKYSKVTYTGPNGPARYEIRAVSGDRKRVRLVGFNGKVDFWTDAEKVSG